MPLVSAKATLSGSTPLSIAEPRLVSTSLLRSRARRIVVLASRETEVLPLRRIAERRGRKFEIARVVVVGDDHAHETLLPTLKPERLREDRIWGILIASNHQCCVLTSLLLQCRLHGINVMTEADFLEEELKLVNVDGLDIAWLLSKRGFRLSWVHELAKRLLDLFIALVLLVLTLPLMLIIAALIKLDSPGSVLYRQERAGYRNQTFTLYKFRSMHEDAEPSGHPRWAAVGDPRITRIGRFIRYTRMDELPQLLNVLRGEMSIVGPRPERPYFVEMLSKSLPLYSTRHYIKPGITGWAQINAPYGASIEDGKEKLQYDLYYLKYRGLLLDLFILWRTVRVVMFGLGAR